jgi:hypothetical protein
MSSNRLIARICVFASVLALGFTPTASYGQKAEALSAPRVLGSVNESQMAPLNNSMLPIARASVDRGRVPDGAPTGHMLMVLKRSETQQRALDALVAAQKDPESPSYHKWLTPEQFGAQFGVADADVQAVTSYLADQGFQVGRVFKNKMAVEFAGTTGQVRSAFRTEIHSFALNGRSFNANVSAPQIPAALAPVVKGITLNNYKAPVAHATQRMVLDRKTGRSRPAFSDQINGDQAVSPGDLDVIYDIPAAATGSGVTVGVISDSNINLAIPANYRTLFGLPASTPTVVVDGTDPGVNADSDITYGAIELLAATAPQAQVNLYTSANTDLDTGLDFATIRALDDNSVQVLVFGFEGCEANLGPNINLLFDNAWQQASVQGISVIVGAGGGGAAECDAGANGAQPPNTATHGLAVNGYASTPFDTAVGASDFFYGPTGTVNLNDPNNIFYTYWSLTNGGAAGFTSAKMYIPEQPSNFSNQATNQQTFTPTFVLASGGGVSTLGQTADDGVTQGPYAQPSYQAAVAGGISPSSRVVPDVSFFGGNFNNFSTYMLCIDPADCVNGTPDGVQYSAGGNSALAASAFAGVAALVVQAHGAQGNLNNGLYATAAAVPSAFHDITGGTNQVACTAGSPDCPGAFTSGYSAGPGYDAASGLGSVDVANLISGWKSTIGGGGAAVTLSLTEAGKPISSFRHNDPVDLTVTVAGGSGTPTGDVLITATTVGNPNLAVVRLTLDSTGTAIYPGIGGLLPGGSYRVVARYAGDANYAANTASTPVTVTGVPAKLVMVTTDQQNNPLPVYNGQTLPYGTNVHFSFFVSDANDPNDPASASGNLVLADGGKQVAILPLNSEGFASFSSSMLGAGAHVFSATYSGDPTFSAASLTGPGPSLIIAGVATTTTLVSTDPNPSVANNTLSLVATVTPVQVCAPPAPCPTGAAPAGRVQFRSVQNGVNGSMLLGTVTLGQGVNSGSAFSNTAVLTLPRNTLAAGHSYSITAKYLPSGGDYVTSTSTPVTVAIGTGTGAVGTITSIATTPAGATNFVDTSSLLFVATVSNTVNRRPVPTGNVTFFSNGTAFPPVALDAAGIAAFMVPQNGDGNLALPLGQSSILAQYDGDATHAPSSTVYTVNVYDQFSTPDFAMQSNTTYQTVSAANRTARFTLQFTSMNNLAGLKVPITLSYAAPAGITCSGAPASPNFRQTIYATVAVTCRTTAATKVAQLTTPKNPQGSSRGFWMAEGGAALACILLFGIPGQRRRWQTLMGSLALFVVAFGFTGCGATPGAYVSRKAAPTNSSASANAKTPLPAGNYTVIVTGTAPVYNPTQPNTTLNVVHNAMLRIVVQ